MSLRPVSSPVAGSAVRRRPRLPRGLWAPGPDRWGRGPTHPSAHRRYPPDIPGERRNQGRAPPGAQPIPATAAHEATATPSDAPERHRISERSQNTGLRSTMMRSRPARPRHHHVEHRCSSDVCGGCGHEVRKLRPGKRGPAAALIGGIRVLGYQAGQLRVDLAHHRPNRGDPCLQIGGIRALAVGVELVDGLGHTPESGLVYRTHRRRLSGRRRQRACFERHAYPQASRPFLWTTLVDYEPRKPREVFLTHSRWITFSLLKRAFLASGRSSPQFCPQAAHNVAGVSAHFVHNPVHCVTWYPARRAARMS